MHFCFFFLWRVQLCFFSLANEQAQQNDPGKKSVFVMPICIGDGVGNAHGKKRAAAHSSIFQHKCLVSLWA